MATFKNDPLSYQVIGCALEVYKTLGPGLLAEKYLFHAECAEYAETYRGQN